MRIHVKRTDGIFICGMRGSGKTYASLKFIDKIPDAVILDPTGIYRAYGYDSFVVDPLNYNKVEQILIMAFKQKRFVVVDEIDAFDFSRQSALRALVMRARNWGVGYLAITRRPAEVDKGILANATWSLLFANYELNTVKYLASMYNATPDEILLPDRDKHTFLLAKYETLIRDKDGNPKLFKL